MQSRVYSVEEVHIESTMLIPDNPPAIAVSAKGSVPTSGWTHVDLAPWMYIVQPRDGILDLDFVATPPTGLVLQVFSKVSVVKTFPVPDWVRGVRVHSSTNKMEAALAGAAPPSGGAKPGYVKTMGEGLPLPWPFPWWAPNAK